MTDNNNKLLEKVNLQKIVEDGKKIYEEEREKYDTPENKGKFLAIEPESKDMFMGDSSAEVLIKAKEKHPDKLFYVIKIGHDFAEIMAKALTG